MNKSVKFLAVSLLLASSVHAGGSDSYATQALGYAYWAAGHAKQVAIGAGVGFVTAAAGKSADVALSNVKHTAAQDLRKALAHEAFVNGANAGANIALVGKVQSLLGQSTDEVSGTVFAERTVGNYLGQYAFSFLKFEKAN